MNVAVCYMCVDPSKPFDKYTQDILKKRDVSGFVNERQLNSGLLFMRGGIPQIIDVTVKWFYYMLDVRMWPPVQHDPLRARTCRAAAAAALASAVSQSGNHATDLTSSHRAPLLPAQDLSTSDQPALAFSLFPVATTLNRTLAAQSTDPAVTARAMSCVDPTDGFIATCLALGWVPWNNRLKRKTAPFLPSRPAE